MMLPLTLIEADQKRTIRNRSHIKDILLLVSIDILGAPRRLDFQARHNALKNEVWPFVFAVLSLRVAGGRKSENTGVSKLETKL